MLCLSIGNFLHQCSKTLFGLTETDETKSSKILELAQKGSNVISTDLSWANQISELVQKSSRTNWTHERNFTTL